MNNAINDADKKEGVAPIINVSQSDGMIQSTTLARNLLTLTEKVKTRADKKNHLKQYRLITSKQGLRFLMELTDLVFRKTGLTSLARQMNTIFTRCKPFYFFLFIDRVLSQLYVGVPHHIALLLTPFIRLKVRRDMSLYLVKNNDKTIHAFLNKMNGLGVNFTVLGEQVCGYLESKQRLCEYKRLITIPDSTDLCIKLSALTPHLNPISFDHNQKLLSVMVSELFRLSMKKTGGSRQHMIHVDMESYRDLELTVSVFKSVLSQKEFYNYTASIALQAYLPDTTVYLLDLITFAQQRVKNGGAPIRIRLVKGANLAMEKVEASLKGWPQAPFSTKQETDTQFKRLLHMLFKPDVLSAVRVGVGSHNLFDISYTFVLRESLELKHHVEFEMLEGMGDPLNKVMMSLSAPVLMYCPLAKSSEFEHAIAYLVRRLDENSSPDHFLYDFFNMKVDDDAWVRQKRFFEQSFDLIKEESPSPFRVQNRRDDSYEKKSLHDDFVNEPDTDWGIRDNRSWVVEHLKKDPCEPHCRIPLVIGGENIREGCEVKPGYSPNHPSKPIYDTCLATIDHVDQALNNAVGAMLDWEGLSINRRGDLLLNAGRLFKEKRGRLIQLICHDAGKTVEEADGEVSEAIDFIHYYVRSALDLRETQDLSFKAKGPVLVTPPWNFPCAISVGCIVSALITGNTVLFKPAPETSLIAWELVNYLWEAGIPKSVLQFIPCEEDDVGTYLIKDPRVKLIQLTGSSQTAKTFSLLNPTTSLIAETGGKNTIIITGSADLEQAILGVLASAFLYSGQKCSAASLCICTEEVFKDKKFQASLKDAVTSLEVGVSTALHTDISPLISRPNPRLQKAFLSCERGETWLVEPKQRPDNSQLWSPGVKYGVKPGSYFHQTECFGPVLGVMKVKDLDEAIQVANDTVYGLTAGLYTLDEEEKKQWLDNIMVGNAYINRETTGAIVKRQPFGGCKQSSFGLGYKAGGPHYLNQLWDVSESGIRHHDTETFLSLLNNHVIFSDMLAMLHESEEKNRFLTSVCDYEKVWKRYLKQDDHSGCLGQQNYTIYKPHDHLTLRIQEGDRLCDVLCVCATVYLCGLEGVTLSYDPRVTALFSHEFWLQYKRFFHVFSESDEDLGQRLIQGGVHRIRFFKRPPKKIFEAASKHHVVLDCSPVLWKGEFELMHVLREMTVSDMVHRYGNCYYGDK